MRGYPQISFWISIALAKICFSCSHKPNKNTSLLVGTVLKKLYFKGMIHSSWKPYSENYTGGNEKEKDNWYNAN